MKTFKSFYDYIWHHPWYFSGYLLFGLLGRISENIQPFFFRWITAGVSQGDFYSAVNLVVGLLLILALGTICYSLGWALADRGLVKSSMELQLQVMKKIHNLDFTYHTEKSSGKLISLMKRGEDAFFNMFDVVNAEFFSLGVSLIFMLYAFSGLGIRYVLITFVAIVLSALVSFPIIKINLKRRVKMNSSEDAVSAARVDNLINFDTVKYFAKEIYEQNRLWKLLETWYRHTQSFLNTYRYLDISVGNISNFALAGTIFLAVFDLQSGRISIPDFVLISSFSSSFFPRLMHFVMVFRNGAKRFSDLQAYFDILAVPVIVKDPDIPQTLSHVNGTIKFMDISFAYHQQNPIFKNFSLEIQKGESVALVGLSGSGKTTLVKLLMRMYDIDSGSISIDGLDIRSFSKSYLRSLIGIVPQDPLMFNHSLRYNISYADQAAPEVEIWEALRLAKLDEFVRSLPDGLETQVGERGIKLSGGQRQRLAIARVLLERAKIIVLDEATSSLDSESEGIVQEAFWALVKNTAEPRTSIIIAHRLSTVMRSDRIIVLDNGQIAETGTHSQLLKNKNGLYNHLWSLQQNGFLADSTSK